MTGRGTKRRQRRVQRPKLRYPVTERVIAIMYPAPESGQTRKET